MKKNILFGSMVLVAGSLLAADSTPKDDIITGAQKLADSPNYSWHTTVVVPEDAQFKPGPTDGKLEKGGFTDVKLSLRDNTMELVMKDGKAAVTNPDGGWQSLAELQSDDQGPGRFLVGMIQNFKSPAAQATNILASLKDLKADGDAYAADMTEDGAKAALLASRRRNNGGDAPTVSNASGSAKFWVKDGVLTKFEFKVKGTVSFNGNDRDIDRDTTVEIKDVGATKVEVPDDAKKKLS